MPAKKFGNSICQTQFSVRNWAFTSKKRQTIASSSVLLIYLDSPVPRSSLTRRRRAERVFALLTTFRLIFLISGDINGILWKKCLLLRINKAISHFSQSSAFEPFGIWIFWVKFLVLAYATFNKHMLVCKETPRKNVQLVIRPGEKAQAWMWEGTWSICYGRPPINC